MSRGQLGSCCIDQVRDDAPSKEGSVRVAEVGTCNNYVGCGIHSGGEDRQGAG